MKRGEFMVKIISFLILLMFITGISYGAENLIMTDMYSYVINITGSDNGDDLFVCTFTVKNKSGKILYNPRIVASPGKEALIETGNEKDINIKFNILINREKDGALYNIKTLKSQKVIDTFTGTVTFEQ